jgi:dTDP-4-dehydrorhamnose reductase
VKETVLIIGISSFVGSNLAETLKDKYRVIGTYFNTPVKVPGVLTISCDILDKRKIQQVLYTFKPEFTIYCAGLSSVRDCKEFPKVADALNTAGVFNVSTYTERYGSKFIYISSSFVFPGEDQVYTESDSPLPCCIYGTTVASTEFFIQKSCLNYLIFRSCPLYGRSINVHDLNFFERLERSANTGKKMSCDDSVFTGFLDIQLFVLAVKICLERGATNKLLQISSQDTCSRYDFAQMYAEVFNQNKSCFPIGSWDFPVESSIFSMNSLDENLYFKMDTLNLQRSIGIVMPSVKESIEFTYKRFASNIKKKGMVKKAAGINYI